MATAKTKHATSGRRGFVKPTHRHFYKGHPEAALLEPQQRKTETNARGHITIRHKSGGHKHPYRVIDFKRNKDGIPARVETIEFDRNRMAPIALVVYADGERRYVIAPHGLQPGAMIMSGTQAPVKVGNSLPIRNIPLGSTLHCLELIPGKGAQLARTAGSSVTLMACIGVHAQVRLRSGEVLRVHIDCRATIGEVSHEGAIQRIYPPPGQVRWKGVRPTVRGVVMNPVDHPTGKSPDEPLPPWTTVKSGGRSKSKSTSQNTVIARALRDLENLPQVVVPDLAKISRKPSPTRVNVSKVTAAASKKLLERIPDSEKDRVVSRASRVRVKIAADRTIEEYANRLMAPTDATFSLELFDAPFAADDINSATVVAFFPSGEIRPVGTVKSHQSGVVTVQPFNLWSLIDPLDEAQTFDAGVDISLDFQAMLLLTR